MQDAVHEIVDALQDYFDGFHTGDVARLQRIFHPNCHLYSAADGTLLDDDMETVYARVAARENPAERGDTRYDRILTIDRSGPECAFVKLQLAIAPKYFTDYLTLVKLDGSWRIITKTYTYVPLAQAGVQPVQQAAE